MLFRKRASTKQLSRLARALSTSLHAGVPLIKTIETATRKHGNHALREVMSQVVIDVKSGSTLAEALDARGDFFPDLFVDMAAVAEQTGKLPEVLKSLADHYENNVKLRQEFLTSIIWPVLQLTMAIFVIAALIYILGWIADSQGGEPVDILGWGLTGSAGALTWISGWFLGTLGLWFAYKLSAASRTIRMAIHRAAMGLPVIGTCMRDFAIARFSWAFHLTQSAGMPIDDSLDASLAATGNAAFSAVADQVIADVMAGEPLSVALDNTRLFPEEFIHIVEVAETSGTVPEELNRLSPDFEEQARRSLRALTIAAAFGVWACVAAIITFMIFRIFLWYTGLINEALEMV